MDARRICIAFLAIALTWTGAAFGASARSTNFIVSTPSPQFSQQVAQMAEKCRRDLAIEWLGHELPQWRQPCPVVVMVGHNLGAGGATSFSFDHQGPYDWRMSIQGPPDRLLDSVLPHEVLHTIFATHFGCPLPRWADEGACTTIEHPSEIAKYHDSLIQALTSGRGIPFNRLFAMKEYPQDVLPLYAQGHSLARFLLAHGGKRRYVAYVGDGMRWNNWTAATKKHYGFESLSELQVTWNKWVAQGCPSVTPRKSPSLDPLPEAAEEQLVSNTESSTADLALAPRAAGAAADGWYSRKRHRALNARQLQPIPNSVGPQRTPAPMTRPSANIATLPQDNQMARPQQPQTSGQIVVEPGQGVPRTYGVPSTAYPQTMPAPRPIPMTTPGTPMRMTTPVAPMPMTVPVAPSFGNTPARGVVYPITNAAPMTMSPSPYVAAPCYGSS